MARRETQPTTALPVETARAAAVIMLVSFHVIGGPDGRGLGLDAGHPLRLYADLLIDVRMPLFAFIAGLVYALRPVAPERLGSFLKGKLRRLVIPGAVAMTLFAVAAIVTGASSQPPDPFWMMYFQGYSIFWFLQTILLIFATAAVVDILSRGRLLLPMLVGSSLALCLGWTFSSTILSANRLTSLLPYFLLGVFFVRHGQAFVAWRVPVLWAATAAFLVGLAMNLAQLAQTGALSTERLDLQSLLSGAGICVAAMLVLPNLRQLSWLGAYSFSIYLYHIFATTGAREGLLSLGIDRVYVHLIVGTALGLALPAILHFLASKWQPSRQILLGLRSSTKPVTPDRPASLLPDNDRRTV
jgi:peptidoglycan/LPS O-acetylase OafA/YrhL